MTEPAGTMVWVSGVHAIESLFVVTVVGVCLASMGRGRRGLGESRRVSLLCSASNSLKKVMRSCSAAAGGSLAATTGPTGTMMSVGFSWVLAIEAPVE